MPEQMIRGLLGDDGFVELLARLPDRFFSLGPNVRDALWRAVLGVINDGEKDVTRLLIFAKVWIGLYTSDIKVRW